ncbi:disease resistance protein RPM1-like [Abrus precatorius]|uniref:Disease resistance protein RPM1-like n=1 Tax=Abrus precatorius TaxID=3816 RepID=A0A8B8KBE8_ABRPR|nr:disease resistance protein RPM1-like [Abrus precatorius]
MEMMTPHTMTSKKSWEFNPTALPCEPADFIKTMILRLQIAYKVQNVKSRVRAINEIRERKSDFKIQPFMEQGPSTSRGNQYTTLEKIRRAPLYMDEAQIVGFEEPRDELVCWLIRGRTERIVISVVGMGGQGKTTLAKNVFDNQKVIEHFDCHAWITVSQSYNVDDLLRDMLQKFYKERKMEPPQNISKMRGDTLIDEVNIDFAALDSRNGSRIVITTRHKKVADSCKKSSFLKIHELKSLPPEQSWVLFCKKAFQFEFDGSCTEKLKDISSKIVKKCNGLPLALVVIGSLLSRKDTTRVDEWEKFYRELKKNQQIDSIKKILGFSYNDLPYLLKSCFLYFGIYPEDREIKSKRLIRQWIAEGIVKYEEEKSLEEVAEGYLEELIDRSLVQASSLTRHMGKLEPIVFMT